MPHRSLRVLPIALLSLAATAVPAHAVNTVQTANGLSWQIHDASGPPLDSGSIRAITGNAFYGFGNVKVRVSGIPDTDPTKLFNGEMIRGYGLRFDGLDTFTTTSAPTLGGVVMSREVAVNRPGNYTRFLDSFRNNTSRTITVDVSFGGTAGLNTGTNQSQVVRTGSGDTVIASNDSFVETASSAAAGPTLRGPSAVVLGTPAPFSGALSGTGNQQRNPFGSVLPTTGLDANFYGYKNTLTLAPGQRRSILHFVVAGTAETANTAGQQITAVGNAAATLASTPNLDGLTTGQRCSLANFNPAGTPGIDGAACAAQQAPETPATPATALPVSTSPYDVFDKSVTQLQADMVAGVTTSQEITRAYLDRIAAYDGGAFGFHSFITVAKDAMTQAKAADTARSKGAKGDLLGIPIAVKDLYDTKDMPTTDGTLALDGWRPKKDAFQVAKMRDAGAVILGKTNLSEFANSGSYSDSGYLMTWNAFQPSKTSLGSSGGTASAVSLSMAAFGMGTQTGVSLYAPSTGASLASLRGTDGISSGAGVMPLTYLQDFEGPIARTTSDLASILNITTGTDPGDPNTLHNDAGAKRPADYKAALDKDALKGKKIGFVPAAFDANSSYGQNDGTVAALKARFADLQAAGATMVQIDATLPLQPTNPTLTGSRTEEGWQHYWDPQVDPPFRTAAGILSSPRNLPYNRTTLAPAPRMTAEDYDKIFAFRDEYKARWKQYMDTAGVDAIIYPGFRSDIYDNDGAQTISSDRNTGVPTSNVGLPTLILPVGLNPDGDPMSLQIVGRAFDDAKVLGFGYALEQQLGGKGHLAPGTAPKLAYDASASPVAIPTVTPAPTPVTTAPFEPPSDAAPTATPVATPAGTPAPTPAYTIPPGAVRLVAKLPKTGREIGRGAKRRVTLRIANAGKSRITGTVVLRRGGKRLGVAKISLAAGKRRTLTVKLNARGRRVFKAHRKALKVRATFTLTPKGGTKKTLRRTLSVKP